MRRSLVFTFAITLLSAVSAQAQVGMPGIEYSNTIAGGDGVQQYPYDQQDPWLHGYYQRVPAYGGFASFRPYNYRHVFSQTQISTQWGSANGMPYSQQFWNKYRGSYLDQNLHSQMQAQPMPLRPSTSVYPASSVRPIVYESAATPLMPMQPATAQTAAPQVSNSSPAAGAKPIHVFPGQ